MNGASIEHAQLDEVLLADLNLRIGRLKHQLQVLEGRKQALEAARTYKQQVFQELRANVDMRPLSREETDGKSQREILETIARRNHDWLVVQAAIKLMADVGILQQETASAQIYTVLRQNKKQFTLVQPGIYRLVEDSEGTVPSKPQTGQRNVGLVDKVASLLLEHPDWKAPQVCAELLRQGWNFGGKKPMSATAMTFANIAKRKKAQAKQPKLQLPTS